MQNLISFTITGSNNRLMPADLYLPAYTEPAPLIIFSHGFNGYKDWGAFPLVAQHVADTGFAFLSFNYSHNGTTSESPTSFADLDAFGENNFTKELYDLDAVLNAVSNKAQPFSKQIDSNRIALLGHSMGGGISILKAGEDNRVKALATWASISEAKTPWSSWPPERMEEWKNNGVTYLENGRTHQQMPLGYQLYDDYTNNHERLNIEKAMKRLDIPILICHGNEDQSVSPDSALKLKEWQPNAQLFIAPGDHTFGQKEPWTNKDLPRQLDGVLEETIAFFQQNL